MVPFIWHAQEGTNLSKDKVKSFKEIIFFFNNLWVQANDIPALGYG
jgi:hypothetical protein